MLATTPPASDPTFLLVPVRQPGSTMEFPCPRQTKLSSWPYDLQTNIFLQLRDGRHVPCLSESQGEEGSMNSSWAEDDGLSHGTALGCDATGPAHEPVTSTPAAGRTAAPAQEPHLSFCELLRPNTHHLAVPSWGRIACLAAGFYKGRLPSRPSQTPKRSKSLQEAAHLRSLRDISHVLEIPVCLPWLRRLSQTSFCSDT